MTSSALSNGCDSSDGRPIKQGAGNGEMAEQGNTFLRRTGKVNGESYAGGDDHSTGSDSDSSRVVLKKEINLLHAVSIMAGIMIGSGIFVSPISITHHCGSIGLSLVVWALSGLIVLCMTLCYTELGTMFKASGAEYSYFSYAIGHWLGFLFAWFMFIVTNPAFFALLALTTSAYIFKPFFPDCNPPPVAMKLFSIWVVASVVFLNSVYVRYVTRAQTFFMFCKVFILIVIIIAGIIQISKGNTAVLDTGFENTSSDIGGIAIAFYSGIFTYGGWQYTFMVIEEIKEPTKNIPRATYISFFMVTLCYILTNVAYFSVMSPEEMMTSQAVAVDFGKVALGRLGPMIPIFVACSTIGALNGSIFGGARINFAAARDGVFPGVLSMIHIRYLTPTPSVIVTGLLTVLFIISGEAVALVEYLGFSTCLISSTALGVLLYLRWREPNRPRPYKPHLAVPLTTLVVLVALTLLGFIKNPGNNAIGLAIALAGLPFYFIFVYWKDKPEVITDITDGGYALIQKILLVVPPEEQ